MTKERKMGVVNSARGDFMAACNLLTRGRAAEKEDGGEGEKSCRKIRKEVKMKMQIERRVLVLLTDQCSGSGYTVSKR